MKGFISKTNVIAILEIIIGFIITVIFYSSIPEMVPTHWNAVMEPNGYMQKPLGAFFAPLMNLGLFFMFLILPKIDPKRKNYGDFKKFYSIIRILMHTVLLFIQVMIILWSLSFKLDFALFGQLFGCLILIIMGNYLSTVKFNYFVGIRTPWTLANETVWKKTHRIMGYMSVVIGAAGLIFAFILSHSLWGKAMVYLIILWAAFGFMYSYLVFPKQ